FGGRSELIVLEKHQGGIELNVKLSRLQALCRMKGIERRRILAGFEIGESHPVLQLRIARPARHRFLAELQGLIETAHLEKGQQQAAMRSQIVWRNPERVLKQGLRLRQIAGVKRRLAFLNQTLRLR